MGIKVADEIQCNKVSGLAGHQQKQSYHSILLYPRSQPWSCLFSQVPGVHLDTHLIFNIDAITRKANSIRGFLGRDLGHCTRKLKEAAYTIFVRPCVEYASCTWDPHTQRNIRKLEQVQRSCARFVTGDFWQQSSVSAMLKDLKWPTLEDNVTRVASPWCSKFSKI